MHSSVVSTMVESCATITAIQEHFHPPAKKPVLISGHSLWHPPLNPWQPSIYFLSTIPDISYKWNHLICGLLWLAPFTWHVFKVPLRCSMYQLFIPFYHQTIFHDVDIRQIIYLFISWWWTFGSLPLWGIANNIAVNIHVQILVWTYLFNYLEYVARSGIAGHIVTLCLTSEELPNFFLKNKQKNYFTVLLTEYGGSDSPSFSPTLLSVFYFSLPNGNEMISHCDFKVH